MYASTSYRFLHVTRAKADCTATGSDIDCAAPLHVEEEEVVVLAVGNPSSLLTPEKTCKEVPETRSQGWSVQQGCNHIFLYLYVHLANYSDSDFKYLQSLQIN